MFKAPNIKGPRFRKDYKAILTKELYTKFIKSHSKYTDLNFTKFKAIISDHSGLMWKAIIDSRDGVEVPIGGTIFIGSTKIRKKNNYDIQASIKANAPIKHRNYNTDGYVAKIYYSPRLSKVGGRDRSIWSFKGYRGFKRTIGKEYPKDWKKYIIVTDLYTVVKNYHRHKYRNIFTERTKRVTETYNEFDLN